MLVDLSKFYVDSLDINYVRNCVVNLDVPDIMELMGELYDVQDKVSCRAYVLLEDRLRDCLDDSPWVDGLEDKS